MFFEWTDQLVQWWSPFNVFRYITFRSAYATVSALLICFIFGDWFIARLQHLQVGEKIREEGPQHHQAKAGTPTMGGLLILAAVLIPMLLWGNLGNDMVIAAMLSMIYMGGIGFIDDWRKLKGYRAGLSGRWKLLAQAAWGAGLGFWLVQQPALGDMASSTTLPFLKGAGLDWGILYIPLVVVIFTGTTNAVNLADGLDGLAAGLCAFCFLAFAGLAYVSGHAVFSDYLALPFLRDAAELTVFCAALLGACLGFLWFNCHPAQIFMGDTGSMALGGALASLALMVKQEFLLVIVGGVFVAEALSVSIQVVSYKTRGKRVFLMAPLHHHFEKLGWSEEKVVIRFWIVGALLVLLSISTLKLR